MKTSRILPLVLALVLLAAVVVTALIIDAENDRKMQEQMATADPYVPSTTDKNEPSVPDPTTDPDAIPAPELALTDDQGRTYSLSSFARKPVVMCFVASQSADSAKILPVIQEAYEAHREDIHFLLIFNLSGSETTDSVAKFVSQHKCTVPVYYDVQAITATNYLMEAYPTAYFLNAKSEAVAYMPGYFQADTMNEGISRIIEK